LAAVDEHGAHGICFGEFADGGGTQAALPVQCFHVRKGGCAGGKQFVCTLFAEPGNLAKAEA